MDISLTYGSIFVFIFGAIVGSLLNVCILRLPLEKSVFWPSSRCATCLTALRFYENLPLLGYWITGGRCRTCKTAFSARYFLIELFTALGFLGLFWLLIANNSQRMPYLTQHPFTIVNHVPWVQIVIFLHAAALFSLLVVAAVCDLDRREIPLTVTVPGTFLGLIFAVLLAWPWPNEVASALPKPNPILGPEEIWQWPNQGLELGVYPWPAWGPLPDWLYGSPLLGLLTGVAGALVGTFLLRAVKFLFEKGLGREALGLGDADLMMMAGAFLGWQPVVAAFFLGAIAALVLAVPLRLFASGGDTALPFGPGLAVGTVVAWLGWRHVGPTFQVLFFKAEYLTFLAVLGSALVFLLSFLMGWFRRRRE